MEGIVEVVPRFEAKTRGSTRYFTGKACKHGHVAERNTKTGTCSECLKGCVRAYERRNFREVDERRRAYHLKKYYGIAPAEYEALLFAQQNSCAICRSTDPKDRWDRFHVDHDHRTGKVRGLLCGPCNTAIGKLKDSIPLLKAAIEYLQENDKCQ